MLIYTTAQTTHYAQKYRSIMKVWDFPKISALNIYFVTSKAGLVSIAKPKNVFRSTMNPSKKLI